MANARSAVIVDAVRTPGGRRNGKLKDWHAADLAGLVLNALVERTQLDPALVEDVIMGCVIQAGEQSVNIGRNAVLAAGWPESVPATTVDRQCGSGQQAANFAAQGVIAGAYDIAVAAGTEVMTRTPMGTARLEGRLGLPYPQSMQDRYAETGLPHQGTSAQILADRYGLTRTEMDALSAESHRRALVAVAEGRFDNELVPVPIGEGGFHRTDEGIREGVTVDSLAGLKPAFSEDGSITAGNSSQIADGASGLLIMEEAVAARLGLRARARFHTFAVVGSDPVTMLSGPIPATQRALAKAGLTLDDIDRFEVNEAFASVPLAWARELAGADAEKLLARTNVNGGAIALGHPLGSSGTKLTATLLNELERTGGRFGLQTMCEAGGMANATIIERID